MLYEVITIPVRGDAGRRIRSAFVPQSGCCFVASDYSQVELRVLAHLAEGKVDLVIGTHRLIQGDIRFKRLGLVIIDEEQRFGVRQKERLKRLRAEVDVLTLTATRNNFV